MGRIASRLSAVKPSASMAASMAAKALRAKGIDVIDLGLGEPDFPTPDHILTANYQATKAGETRYTPPAGTPALRKAVAEKFARENGIACTAEDVVVANGGKQIIFNALMATIEPGDEVILCAPYFVSYPEMVTLLDGVPVVVECPRSTGFRLTPQALEAAITPKTKWLFMNSPNNPSGAVMDAAEQRALGAVLAKHPDVLILSDEIYEHILFDGRQFTSWAVACPELRDRSVIMNGVAKSYSMTGWRIGYAVAPPDLVKAMSTVQSQSVSSVAAPCQAAAVAALTGPQDCIPMFRQAFERRRDLVVKGINAIPGLGLDAPEGAFYAYIDCTGIIGKTTPAGRVLATDADVAEYLLHEGRVSSVAGAAYGLSPFFRISTATADDVLAEAVRRIGEAVAKLG